MQHEHGETAWVVVSVGMLLSPTAATHCSVNIGGQVCKVARTDQWEASCWISVLGVIALTLGKVTKGDGGTNRTEKGPVPVTVSELQVSSNWVQLLQELTVVLLCCFLIKCKITTFGLKVSFPLAKKAKCGVKYSKQLLTEVCCLSVRSVWEWSR